MTKPTSTLASLSLLGPIAIQTREGANGRDLLGQPKRIALLSFLAVPKPGIPQSRDRLIAVFWPESDQARARSALRKTLYRIRRSVGGEVFSDNHGDTVSLNSSIVVVDVARFETALDRGDHEQALDLYRGDLMEGFFLSGAPAFEQWLEEERGRLRRRAEQAAWTLAEKAEAGGQPDVASAWAHRGAAFSPGDETGVQHLMQLLDRLGDRGGALEAYEAHTRYLNGEYDGDPSPETRALLESIRTRTEPHPNAVGESPFLSDRRPGPTPTAETEPSPRRPRRTRFRLAAATAAMAAAAAAAFLVLGRETPATRLPHVLVAVFENRTADSTLDQVGQVAAHWIGRGLGWSGLITIASPTRTLWVTPNVSAMDSADFAPVAVRSLAAEVSATLAIWGWYRSDGDSLSFEAVVSDLERGQIIHRLPTIRTASATPLGGIDAVREALTNSLAVHLDAGLSRWAQLPETPPNLDVYLEFVAGFEQGYLHRNSARAHDHYDRVLQLAPTFKPALLGHQWAWGHHWPEITDSGLAGLRFPNNEHAVDVQVFARDWALAIGDLNNAFTAAQRLARLTPDDLFVQRDYLRIARDGGWYGVLRDAVESIESVDRTYWHWTFLIQALHGLEQYESELELVRELVERDPSSWQPWMSAPLAALGRFDELLAAARRRYRMPTPGPTPMGAFLSPSYKLASHGWHQQAAEFRKRALEAYEQLPSDSVEGRWGPQLSAAELYRMAGRFDEAEALYHQYLDVDHDRASLSAHTGLARVKIARGERETALELVQEIAERFDGSQERLNRAIIAAELGNLDEAMRLIDEALQRGLGPADLHGLPMDFALRGFERYEQLLQELRERANTRAAL